MFSSDSEFEDEIRRIARLLWPAAEFGGADLVDGRERDAIFEADDFVHCIECTVSREKEKAEKDGTKLDKLLKKFGAKHPTKFLKGWFITLDEPTADQRNVLAKYQGRIVSCSYDHFRSKLIDARSYVSSRQNFPFGSMRDPSTGLASFKLDYIPLELLDEFKEPHDVDSVAHKLITGGRVILTGDYGAGKSSTTREIYFTMSRQFWAGKTTIFPLLLNLRDHHGQTDPVEAIERHARLVGFSSPSSLVRAWRAGYCVPMLDGFDEIASAGWAGSTKKLRELRYRSMELIRTFLKDTPGSIGFFLAGRSHFFDSDAELRQSLKLDSTFLRLYLVEFSSERVEQFLAQLGWHHVVPQWLPTRPLLLAYLVSRGILSPDDAHMASPAVGWNELLDRVAEREAEIEAGIDPSTVRRLIERIATRARSSADGLGPLSADDIAECFKTICGYPPDDRGAVLLQRLPGLGTANAEDGSRVIIDYDYAEAARSGDVFHFICDPYKILIDSRDWNSSLSVLGVEIVNFRLQLTTQSDGKLNAALKVAVERNKGDALAADILSVILRSGGNTKIGQYFLREIAIDALVIDASTLDLTMIEVQDSVIGTLDLGSDLATESMPIFRRCHFGNIRGRAGTKDLPIDRFVECTFDEFENAADTTNAILNLPLPISTKVLLTVLKKLYVQSGAGRRDSALLRGLDARARELVPSVLELLKRMGFVTRSRQGTETVWLPTRSSDIRSRAFKMLASPSSLNDPLLDASNEL